MAKSNIFEEICDFWRTKNDIFGEEILWNLIVIVTLCLITV